MLEHRPHQRIYLVLLYLETREDSDTSCRSFDFFSFLPSSAVGRGSVRSTTQSRSLSSRSPSEFCIGPSRDERVKAIFVKMVFSVRRHSRGATPEILSWLGGTTVDCIPGLLYPGPSNSTFLKCVERRYFKHLLKFNCPPGTFFEHEVSLCIINSKKTASTSYNPSVTPGESMNIKPSPVGQAKDSVSTGVPGFLQGALGHLPGLPPPGNELQPQIVEGSPGASRPKIQTPGLPRNKYPLPPFPASTLGSLQTPGKRGAPQSIFAAALPLVAQDAGSLSPPGRSPPGRSPPSFTRLIKPEVCGKYQLDPSSEYNCQYPGMIPVDGRCDMFFVCINTMSCIVKGFSVRCPNNLHFNRRKNRCLHQEDTGSCPYLRGEGQWKEDIKPSIQLNSQNMNTFFNADNYWSYKVFLPKLSDQKNPSNFHLQPADVAKGLSKTKGSLSWKAASTIF